MKKRTLIIALFMLVVPMVLAACGGGLDEGEFADAVEKAFEDGDFGDYNDLVCEDDQIDENQQPGEGDISVECSVEDDTVECDLEGAGETATIRADVDDDDKACDVVIVEGDETIRIVDLLALTAGEGEDVPPADDTTEDDDTGDDTSDDADADDTTDDTTDDTEAETEATPES
jgi:hypothetical protein